MVSVTAFFIAGILLANYNILPKNTAFWLLAAAFASWGALYLFNRLSAFRFILILILFLIAGFFRLYCANELPGNHIANLKHEDVAIILTGVVTEEPVITNDPDIDGENDEEMFDDKFRDGIRGRFVIRCETLMPAGGNSDKTIQTYGLLLVRFYEFTPKIKYGDRVEILGLISSPKPPSNPGGFDYRQYLQRQGIYKTILLTKPDNLKITSSGHGNFILRMVQSVRRKLSEKIESTFTAEHQGLIKALILGDQNAVPAYQENNFQRTGTIHFLSVSGLHVVLVLGMFLWIFSMLKITGNRRTIPLMLITLFYMGLTGFNTPVVRSGIMVMVFLGADLFKRKSNSLNSLALAALIILLYNPNELFSIGFQLSFICVLSMVMLYPEMMRILPKEDEALLAVIPQTWPEKIWRAVKWYIFRSVAVSVSAWLGSALLVITYFNIITPVFIPANLILSPLIFLILLIGLLYLPFSLIGIPLVFPDALMLLSDATTWTVKLLARMPGAYFYLPDIPLWMITGYYTMFCLWYISPYLGARRLKYLLALSGATVLLIAGWIITPLGAVKHNSADITMIDVGNGSSFYMEFPDGKNVLYDSGTTSPFDVGGQTIAPFLWEKGITKIDTIILSHSHLDHINSIPSLLERFRVRRVIISDYWFEHGSNDNGKILVSLISNMGIAIERVNRGDKITLAKDIIGTVMGPPTWDEVEKSNQAFKDPNDISMILKITCKEKSLLLTGDIQTMGILWFLESGQKGFQSDILQIPHHGYKEPRIRSLIEAVQPKDALINGTENSIADETIQLCDENNVKVFSSYKDGAVTIRFGEEGISIRPFKDGN